MTINLYCRSERVDSNGYADIIFLIKQGTKNYKIPSREKCKPAHWINDSKTVSGKVNGAVQLNQRILKAQEALQSIIDSQTELNIADVRTLFAEYLDDPENFTLERKEQREETSFFDIIEQIINSYRTEWSEGHKKKFRSLRTKIIDKFPDFKVTDISLLWWQDYVDYCFDELDNSHNTIQADLKVLHQLCDILEREGHKFNQNIMKASMSYVEPKIEPLEWDEVKAIAELDLSDESDEKYRDVRFFWVACAFIGQRWKDMSRVNKGNFFLKEVEGERERKWYYTNRAQKGKNLIEIPLLPEAVEWLMPRQFEIPKLTQQVVNRDIKVLARRAKINQEATFYKVKKNQVIEEKEPRWKRVHIHTARHSYAVELVKRTKGKPYAEKFVSEMLGHASPNTTWKYFNFISSNKDKMFQEMLSGG